jgi:hypothetical protein
LDVISKSLRRKRKHKKRTHSREGKTASKSRSKSGSGTDENEILDVAVKPHEMRALQSTPPMDNPVKKMKGDQHDESLSNAKPIDRSRSVPTHPAQDRTGTVNVPPTALSQKGVMVRHASKNKDRWTLTPCSSTHTLVIGDSNLADVDQVPPGWEVHAYGGAKFHHVAALLPSLQAGEIHHLKRLVIQVGINHREDREPPKEDIEAVRAAATKLGLESFFVGISYSPACLHPSLCDNIDRLNNVMQYLFGRRYIPPMSSKDVMIKQWDEYQIHYDYEVCLENLRRVVAFVRRTEQPDLSDRLRDTGSYSPSAERDVTDRNIDHGRMEYHSKPRSNYNYQNRPFLRGRPQTRGYSRGYRY